MFTAALFTIARTGKQSRGPLTDEWIKSCGIYTMEYYSAIKKEHIWVSSESVSRSVVSDSLRPHGPYSPWNSPGQNTGVGTSSLLQGIFPIQESNLDLLNFRQILYQLSHKGSPRTLEWVAYPSPADLPNPGIEPGSPVLQADSLPAKPPGKPNLQ